MIAVNYVQDALTQDATTGIWSCSGCDFSGKEISVSVRTQLLFKEPDTARGEQPLAKPRLSHSVAHALCNGVAALREKGTGDRWCSDVFPPICRGV